GGLSRIGLRDASQTDLPVHCGRQHDNVRLNASQLLEDGARRASEPGALLPHLETLPSNEGEKANEDVSLNAVLSLVPDRTHVQLVLLDLEGGFGLGELNIGLPQLLIAPISNVGTQQIGSFRESGTVAERGVISEPEAETCRAFIRLQHACKPRSGALV